MRQTVELAHELGLRVVAEGVEDAVTTSRCSQTLGCDSAQGFHLSRPVPVLEFLALAARSTPAPRDVEFA